jgi:hypothetical protein
MRSLRVVMPPRRVTKIFNIPRTVGDSIFFRKLTRLSRVIWLGFQRFFFESEFPRFDWPTRL